MYVFHIHDLCFAATDVWVIKHCLCVGAESIKHMLGTAGMLQPLVIGVAATFRQLGLQYLALHKAVAKLGYIVTSLLSGVMQEGFCTATESEETEAGGRHVFVFGATADDWQRRRLCLFASGILL